MKDALKDIKQCIINASCCLDDKHKYDWDESVAEINDWMLEAIKRIEILEKGETT